MGKLEQEFAAYRARMNDRVLAEDNRVIKRVYSVDSLAYAEDGGELPKQTRELLGLVASLVLRCDDCVKYHLDEARAAGNEPQGDRRGDEHRARRRRHDRGPAPAPRDRVPRRHRGSGAGGLGTRAGRNTSASMQRTEPPPSVSIVGIGATTMRSTQRRERARAPPADRLRTAAATAPARRAPSARAQFEHVAREARHLRASIDLEHAAAAARAARSTRARSRGSIALARTPARSRVPIASITLV